MLFRSKIVPEWVAGTVVAVATDVAEAWLRIKLVTEANRKSTTFI